MLDANHFRLARIIHEERIHEALTRKEHRLPGVKSLWLLGSMLANIGERLTVFGVKLKAQAASM